VVLAAVAALALAGCGSSHPPRLSPPDRAGLLTRIEKVRAAATAGNKQLALQRLRGFTREVGRLQGAGELDAATAHALVTGATQAMQHATAEIVPPAPAPTPAPAPAPQPKDKGKHKGEEKHPKDEHKPKPREGGD
jgi:outer membrane biosynthesis protein TonB